MPPRHSAIEKTIIEPKKADIGHHAESTDLPVVKQEYRLIPIQPKTPIPKTIELISLFSFLYIFFGVVLKKTYMIKSIIGISKDASKSMFFKD